MFGIIAAVLVALVALIVIGIVVHLLLSPWILVPALGVVAFVAFGRRRRSRR